MTVCYACGDFSLSDDEVGWTSDLSDDGAVRAICGDCLEKMEDVTAVRF